MFFRLVSLTLWVVLPLIGQAASPKNWILGRIQTQGERVSLGVYRNCELIPLDSVLPGPGGRFQLRAPAEAGLYALYLKRSAPAVLCYGGGAGEVLEVQASASELRSGQLRVVRASPEQLAHDAVEAQQSVFRRRADSLNTLGQQLPAFDPQYVARSERIRSAYNQLVQAHNAALRVLQRKYEGTFAAQVLAPLRLVAVKSDFPALDQQFDNNRSFQHYHYFDLLPFADARLLHAPLLKQRYEEYLTMWVSKEDAGYRAAADRLLEATARAHPAVRAYTVGFLLDFMLKHSQLPVVEYVQQRTAAQEGCQAPVVSSSSAAELAVLAALQPGKPAPALQLPDINGEVQTLANSRGRWRTLVYFWASWCPHCREATPGVRALWEQYQPKGLEVYAVSLDREWGPWVGLVQQQQLSWTNVSDLKGWESAGAAAYHVRATPGFFLLDEQGRMLAKPKSLEELQAMLSEKK